MSLSEKVSIVVPVYNVEKYLKKCFDSLLNQSYTDYEIIIIDDGSTDTSPILLDEYQKSNPEIITVYHTENGGVSNARNIGVSKASGKYILFVDSDDYVSRDYVKTFIDGFKTNDIELSIVDYYIDNNGKINTFSKDNDCTTELSSSEVYDMINDVKGFAGYVWNKCFLKSVIEKNNIKFRTDCKIMEDHLFCVQYIDCIKRISYIQKPVYYYLYREKSAVNYIDSKYIFDKLSICENCIEISKKYGGKFEKEIKKMYSDTIISAFNHNLYINGVYDRVVIKSIVDKVEKTSLDISLKNKIMYYLMKYTPYIAYKIVFLKTKKGK